MYVSIKNLDSPILLYYRSHVHILVPFSPSNLLVSVVNRNVIELVTGTTNDISGQLIVSKEKTINSNRLAVIT